jgi:hypothetical protein
MHARQIEPSRLTAADWTLARDALLPALERSGGTHTERDLIDGIGRGAFHLWLDGRPGWERVLRPLGYGKTAVRMFRSI